MSLPIENLQDFKNLLMYHIDFNTNISSHDVEIYLESELCGRDSTCCERLNDWDEEKNTGHESHFFLITIDIEDSRTNQKIIFALTEIDYTNEAGEVILEKFIFHKDSIRGICMN